MDDTSDDSEDKSKKAVEIAEQIKVQNSIKAGKEMVFDEWKIYTSLFLHGLMIMCYIVGFVLFCETLGTSLKFWSKVGYGFLFGGIWRIISPVWPQGRPKKINRFLGMKYSIALSFVTITGIFTLFIASGCVITALMLELSVYVIVCSLLCLGGLSFFMG